MRGDDKPKARRAIIRHLLKTLAPGDVADAVKAPKPERLFAFDADVIGDGRLAR